MTYELSIESGNQIKLTINLPSGLTQPKLHLIDHSKTDTLVSASSYTIVDDVLTYVIPSSLCEVEGDFQYYITSPLDDYESDMINIKSHLCSVYNCCQQVEVSSGEYFVGYKKSVKTQTEIINALSAIPVGEFVIWSGDKLISNTNDWQWIATVYSMKNAIRAKYPDIDGFTKKFKIAFDGTDNMHSGNDYIRVRTASYTKEYLYNITWGSTTDGIRATKIQDFDYDDVPEGHVDFDVTPTFSNTGSAIRFYKIYLLVYYELNN